MAFASLLLKADAGIVSFGSFTGDFVTVGDPGNTADTTGYGAVSQSFDIMTYEVTNSQYAALLNSVATTTDAYSLHNIKMGGADATWPQKGGIDRTETAGTFSYTVKANFGNKPVNWVSWFDAARYANWLHNGATSASSTETGAYDLSNATSNSTVALLAGAKYFIPTENQWYKAAYYKGGNTNAYWLYATQNNAQPTQVTANATGDGSAGNSGNFVNTGNSARWNGTAPAGNLTTVGTNGGPSYYGAYDMNGNVWEWADNNGSVIRGGAHGINISSTPSTYRFGTYNPSNEIGNLGFRIGMVPMTAVPEPSMMVIGTLFGIGGLVAKRRMKK